MLLQRGAPVDAFEIDGHSPLSLLRNAIEVGCGRGALRKLVGASALGMAQTAPKKQRDKYLRVFGELSKRMASFLDALDAAQLPGALPCAVAAADDMRAADAQRCRTP